jgi:hypothetical protein
MLDSGELSSFRSVEYPMVSHETTFRNGSNDDMTDTGIYNRPIILVNLFFQH